MAHWLLLLALNLAFHNVRLQSLVEIESTDKCVDDGSHQTNDGQHGERCERFSRRKVKVCDWVVLIHADDLEEEVGETGKVEDL